MAFIPTYGTGFEMGTIPLLPNEHQYFGISSGHTGNYGIANTHGYNGWINFPGPNTAGEFSMGVWSRDAIAANEIWVYMADGANFSLRTSGAYFDLYINGTKVADGTIPVQSDVWTNIQINAAISSNGFIKVKVSGALDIDYNGNTLPGSSDVPVTVKLRSFGWVPAYGWWDDIVIGYGGFPGDYRYDVLIPVADSTPRQWYRSGISCQTEPSAPTVSIGSSGNLTGDYHYKITFVDNLGETWGGTISALIQPSSQRINLSDIPLGIAPDTTARKIYRTEAGGSIYKLVDTISDNTTTTYEDNKIDGNLGANEPDKTINHEVVDDIPDVGDYIYTPITGDRDMFEMSDWNATQKIPKMVVIWNLAQKDTANGQQVKILHRISGGNIVVGPLHDLTTSPSYICDLILEQPAGGPWNDTAIDVLEVGDEAVIND